MSVPSTPIITQYPVASNQTLQFYWTPPATGAPLINYTLTLNPGALVYTISPGATNYTVSGLTNGTTYTADIYATNVNGSGPAATFESAEPGFLPNPPDSAAATAIAPGIVVVSWSPPSTLPVAPIRYYAIEVVSSDPADNLNPTRLSATSTDRTVYIPNLNPSKQYSFRVYTVNSPGYSGVQTTKPVSFNDNQGQVQWATGLFGSIIGNFVSQRTAVDGDGNIYITASVNSGPILNLFDFVTAPATPGGQISTTVSALYTGTNPAFTISNVIIIKYNSAGILQWAVPIQFNFLVSINTPIILTTDVYGNVIVSVTCAGTSRFTINNFISINTLTKQVQVQPYASYNVSSGTIDIVVFKYNSLGQFQWMTTMGSSAGNESIGSALTNPIATDKAGNIYIWFTNNIGTDTNLTYFYNAAILIGTTLRPILYGGCLGRNFLIKYNAQGQIQWINRITATGASSSTPLALAIDNDTNIITTLNNFTGLSTFIETVVGISAGILSTTRTSCIPAINSTGGFDTMITKFTPNGQFLYATRTNDTQGGGNANTFTAIATDTTNAVYLATSNSVNTSNFLNSYYSTFNGSNVSTIRGPRLQNFIGGGTDLYIIKYNSSFQFQTAAGFYISTGSAVSMGIPGGIVCDSYNNVYFSGNFRSTMQVRTYLSTTAINTMVWSTIATTSNYISQASFLAKFDSALNFKWITILASHDGNPALGNTTTTNQGLSIDNSNVLYTTGVWAVRNPMFMQFANASTITTDRFIQTQPYGYLSSFTSTTLIGISSFVNSYLVKYA